MVLSRDIERTLTMMKRYVDKLNSWNMLSAFAYQDRNGVMHVYGDKAVATVVEENMDQVYALQEEDDHAVNEDQGIPQGENQVQMVLPRVDLDKTNFMDCRNLAMVCVKASLGTNRRNIGWGVPENCPVWWPEHIPWTKNGVQSGLRHPQLKELIRACYQYHGQPLVSSIFFFFFFTYIFSQKLESQPFAF